MMLYSQSSGEFFDNNGLLLATGYSGFESGKNNPWKEHVKNVGPIPRGFWQLVEMYDSQAVGSRAIRLRPIGHDAHGRTDFLIHGDSIANPGTASKGCIILPKAIRLKIWSSSDRLLHVI